MKARRHVPLAAFLVYFLSLATGAAAWEHAYGPQATREQASRGVSRVFHCGTPGYIAVGTLDDGVDPQVYVVFTDLTGAPGWEFVYDVQGPGLPDEGVALVELPNAGGFVILSNTLVNGVWMPALTRIPCGGGAPLWSYVYPDAVAGNDLHGRDLIRTANGDYAVAGTWWNGVDEDALLMRTNAAGALIWNRTYDSGGSEAFNALTEAAPSATGGTDLVAVGRFQIQGDLQGLVARVSGANGGIGGAPHCLAQHGDAASDEVYNSVTLLAHPQHAGQFAMIGTTTSPALLSSIWLSRGNPCALAAQSRIGDPLGVATAEEGFDVIESVDTIFQPHFGVLAIVGKHGPALGGPFDATFLQVSTSNLFRFGAYGRLFGDHAGQDEAFISLSQDPPPFPPIGTYIAAGLTDTAWQPGDPRDLYLVKVDPTIHNSGCHELWEPSSAALTWPPADLKAEFREPARYRRTDTRWIGLSSDQLVCP